MDGLRFWEGALIAVAVSMAIWGALAVAIFGISL